ncbi:transglutaminase family protein [Tsukamurella sp. 8F]|uniref:transglutaminase family protein n=1 Tax=unclassified Tsukamurella TaxID=2633480 RepID=UPI0023B8BC3A|nr:MULTISPECIES: transglutaminase family protein [unclassified Tsukamurella]MDF0532251.1 transglutaminase family protein [Tsukamurella sp. 8J]MDF0589495.1 transglutaminase family protein [Tsukamurella sp. 8F]
MRVVHETGFGYDAPVTSSYNEARLTPRSDSRQNVILNRVETVPATRTYRYTDYWGTAVTAFDLHAPHTALEVSAASVVETEPAHEPEESLGWDDLESEPIRDRFDEFLDFGTYVPRSRRLARVGARLAKDATPAETLLAASQWVHEKLDYVPGTTGVHSSALDAYEESKGVCQDYAHLTLLLLRSAGIPARYVSGYLHPKAGAAVGTTVAGQSHAWIEAWTGQWVGYDPTNDVAITERHVSVGVGRDYADVPPLKGIIAGGGASDLDVEVEITRLA